MTIDVTELAPDFTVRNQHGETVTLRQFRGQKNVLLVFYPWAFTSTCTSELCEIRDRIQAFDNDETTTLAISCDAMYSLRIFAERDGYPFSLLSDFWPHGEVARAYGVFDEDAGVAVRGTFVVDTQGIVRYRVVKSIGDARDPNEYEKVLADLA